MSVRRRTKIASVVCLVTLTSAALISTAGVASASPTPLPSSGRPESATKASSDTAVPNLYGWWIYYYYPNSVLGLGQCLAVGAALKIAGNIQQYYCGDPGDGTDRIALWVYSLLG